MWVCRSGDSTNLAGAWCQDLNDGDHCFLGFWKASPNLAMYSRTYYGSITFYGWQVIESVYYYALVYGYSIYDALDCTSYDLVGWGIENLYTLAHFVSYWPVNPFWPPPPIGPEQNKWYEGGIAGYGNPYIYLT
jgi:hypothetical protein